MHILELRTVKKGREVRDVSKRDKKESIKIGTLRHADKYNQSDVHISELRMVEGDKEAIDAGKEDEFKSIRTETTTHANK